MAIFYLRNTSSNWNATSSWSRTSSPTYTGVTGVPVSTDDVIFQSASGNLTNNVANSTIRTLDCTGYTGTLTLTQALLINSGFTGSSTMTIAGANSFALNGTGTYRSNGTYFPVLQLRLGTHSLLDDWNTGTLNIANAGAVRTNGFTISCTSLTTAPAVASVPTGTTRIVASSSWSHTSGTSYISLPVFAKSSGTFSLGSIVRYGGNTFSVLSGTVDASSCTFHLYGSLGLVDANFIFNIINHNAAGTITTLRSDLRISNYLNLLGAGTYNYSLGTYSLLFTNSSNVVTGNFYYGTNGINLTLPKSITVRNFDIGSTTVACTLQPAGLTVSVLQNLSQWGNASRTAGGSGIELIGTGTWSVGSFNGNAGTTFRLRDNLFINTTGTIIISGTIYYDGGTLKYIQGNVITTGSNLVMISNNTTYDTPGLTFSTITYSGGGGSHRLLLTGDISLTNDLLTTSVVSITSSNNTITVSGSVQFTGISNLYETRILMNGTGNLSSSQALNGYGATHGITIDTSGVITMGSLFYCAHDFIWYRGFVNTVTNNNTFVKYPGRIFRSGTIIWNIISTINGTHNLDTDVFVRSLYVGVTNTATLFNNNTIYIYNNLIISGSTPTLSGTSSIVLAGNVTVDNQATSIPSFVLPLTIDTPETVTFQSGKTFSYSGFMTYVRGKIISTNATLRLGSSTLTGFNKVPLENILVVPSSTLTMDEFFTGRPDKFCNIVTTTGASFFYVWFKDTEYNGMEKFAKFVNVRNAAVVINTLINPGRLIINNNESLTNLTGTNFNLQGIYFYNNLPNGIPRGLVHHNQINTPLTGNNPSDPSFVVPGR